ncbi:glycosyl hydrolase family 95 catalytic domain-containing protein [Micromonospora cathayae]|uniref:Glycoside hydrolase N-terminal domain-containing protein n=1 Tax=Micromonospora cathayae TaxID=3028804 RepID=A0ABY7ZJ01_9ACTN|nr:glycoside hydrolase N-terminal domain-containing protein [Micromonospora sp. HUAS 3]WDZ82926.1 glycoside hydrolase N-terminal domain-containing protein [Micromonospora sp. HUAS 3]
MWSSRSRSLWYRLPATDWQSQALPVGNGRIGAMFFGQPDRERIQFNEHSLWGGVNDYDNALAGRPDSAFDTGMTGFGAYRSFGDVLLTFGRPRHLYVSAPTTGWHVADATGGVRWQADLPSAVTVTGYHLTAPADAVDEHPGSWTLDGSTDGYAWTRLDRRDAGPAPGDPGRFTVAAPGPYPSYRLTLWPKGGSRAVRLAGIRLVGAGPSAGDTTGFDTATLDPVVGYRRALDLESGVHGTWFGVPGARVRREAFASRAADLLVLRYEADRACALDCEITLTCAQGAAGTADAATGTVGFHGVLGNGLRYAAALRVADTDGVLTAPGSRLRVRGATRMTLLLDARTDYRLDAAAGWRGPDPRPVLSRTLDAAAGRSYWALRAAHVIEATAVAGRVAVDWGRTDDAVAALPTDARLARYRAGGPDPDLEQTMFVLGRYLLHGSSRPGGLPANLQGLWNDSDQPPWASDYHTNINVQMNYWGAETANLSESHRALVGYVRQVAVPSRVATRAAFGAGTRGWTARTSQSAFGGNAWEWNTVASAWYALHLYEHWAFTQDVGYLRDTALPMLREICEFWQDRLVENAAGQLVSPAGWSPEHGPREDGVHYDQQIVRDLFQNYLDCAGALDVDHGYRATVADLRARLAPDTIGRWGQLQEWQTDRDDPDDVHRHTSHLFAVFPGRQITPDATPDLAAAALVSLQARCGERAGTPFDESTVSGDSRRSWTWPWRAALFARLGDAERARCMVRGLLRYNTLPNLLCDHPPMQLDGNLGVTGAIVEMLLQSHQGVIHLLPALPADWADGAFRGLRARGGYEVSCAWRAGRVTDFRVVADRARHREPVTVRIDGRETRVVPDAPAGPVPPPGR